MAPLPAQAAATHWSDTPLPRTSFIKSRSWSPMPSPFATPAHMQEVGRGVASPAGPPPAVHLKHRRPRAWAPCHTSTPRRTIDVGVSRREAESSKSQGQEQRAEQGVLDHAPLGAAGGRAYPTHEPCDRRANAPDHSNASVSSDATAVPRKNTSHVPPASDCGRAAGSPSQIALNTSASRQRHPAIQKSKQGIHENFLEWTCRCPMCASPCIDRMPPEFRVRSCSSPHPPSPPSLPLTSGWPWAKSTGVLHLRTRRGNETGGCIACDFAWRKPPQNCIIGLVKRQQEMAEGTAAAEIDWRGKSIKQSAVTSPGCGITCNQNWRGMGIACWEASWGISILHWWDGQVRWDRHGGCVVQLCTGGDQGTGTPSQGLDAHHPPAAVVHAFSQCGGGGGGHLHGHDLCKVQRLLWSGQSPQASNCTRHTCRERWESEWKRQDSCTARIHWVATVPTDATPAGRHAFEHNTPQPLSQAPRGPHLGWPSGYGERLA